MTLAAFAFWFASVQVPLWPHAAHGSHAFGLRRTKDPATNWPQLVEQWLRTIDMLPE